MHSRIRATTIAVILACPWALSLVSGCDREAEPAAGTKAEPAAGEVAGAAKSPGADAKAPKGALPAATELLDRAVVAQGGRAKLDGLTSFYLEGQLAVIGQKITGDMKLWWKAGDFYTEQNMVGIGTVRAGKQGDVIWSEDPINGLRMLEGAEAEQHAWASSPSLPAQWQRYFSGAETTATREVEGKKVHDVELTSKSGAKVTLSFDAESGLQVGQSFEQTTPMGNMPISVELQDYRDVDGLLLPHLQVTDAKLAKATQTLTKVEFGVEIDDTKFAMPTNGAPPAGAAAPPVP